MSATEQCVKTIQKEKQLATLNVDDHKENGHNATEEDTAFTVGTINDNHRRTSMRDRRSSVYDDNALREKDTDSIHDDRLKSMTSFYKDILISVGEDPSREGTDEIR